MRKEVSFSIFLILFLSFVLAVTTFNITTFSNGNSTGNITFNGNENQTVNISIPLSANITSAFLNLSGFDTSVNCYQESFNISDQTGIDGNCNLNYSGNSSWAGDDDMEDVVDGNWNTGRNCASYSGGTCNKWVNYTKPDDAVSLINSFWKVKDQQGSEELNISSCSWDDGILQFRIDSYIANGYNIRWSCINSTGYWLSLRYRHASGGAGTVYEEAMQWMWGEPLNPFIEINNTEIWKYNTSTVLRDSYPLTDNLTAYFKLKELKGVIDDNHSTNDATVHNVTRGSPGKIGKGFSFDGVRDHIELPTALLDTVSDNISMSLWFKINNISGNHHIINAWECCGGDIYNWDVLFNSTSIVFNWRNSTGGNTNYILSTPFTDTTSWHHLMITFTPGNRSLYLDGDLKDNDGLISQITTIDNVRLTVGGLVTIDHSVSQNYFNGTIDEISVWNRILNQSEVSQIYNSGEGLGYIENTTMGIFNQLISPNTTDDFSSVLNSALNGGTCNCNGCSIDSGNCSISLLFHSDDTGLLQYSSIDIQYQKPEGTFITPSNWQVSMLTSETVFNTWTIKNTGIDSLTNCIPKVTGNLGSFATFDNTGFNLSSDVQQDVVVTITQPLAGEYNSNFSITCNTTSFSTEETGYPTLIFSSVVSTSAPSSSSAGSSSDTISVSNIKLIRPTSKIILQGAVGEKSDKVEFVIKNIGTSKDTFRFKLSGDIKNQCKLKTNQVEINGESTYTNWIQCDFSEESYEGKIEITSTVLNADTSLKVQVSSTVFGAIVSWVNALVTGGKISFFGWQLPAWTIFLGIIFSSLALAGFVKFGMTAFKW